MQGILIGITGLYGSGKDTVADMLIKFYPQFNLEKISLADGVREVFTVITGQEFSKNYTQDWKNEFNSTFQKTNRELLEGIGHGLRLSIGEDVWLNRLITKMKDGGNYIIPDVRYENEMRAIEQRGGRMIRVVRPDNPFPQSNTPSNSQLEGFDMIEIINSGHRGDLANAVVTLGEEFLFYGKVPSVSDSFMYTHKMRIE